MEKGGSYYGQEGSGGIVKLGPRAGVWLCFWLLAVASAAGAGEFVENWDSTEAGGDGLNSFSLGPVLSVNDGEEAVERCRCQYSDPAGPNSASLLDAALCRPWTGSDWHVHLAGERAAPKAFSGDGALYMGRHGKDGDPSDDGYTLGQLSQAVSPVLKMGYERGELSFWHIVSLADERTLNTSGALDRATVQVARVDGNGTPTLPWQTIAGTKNGYDAHADGTPYRRTCSFDPIDDGSTVGDMFPWPQPHLGPSSTCGEQAVYSNVGHWSSLDPQDVGDVAGPGVRGRLGTGIWVDPRVA